MNKSILGLLLTVLALLCVGSVSASAYVKFSEGVSGSIIPDATYKQGLFNISIPCYFSTDTPCTENTTCVISLTDQLNMEMVKNAAMVYDEGSFKYEFNNSGQGLFTQEVKCHDDSQPAGLQDGFSLSTFTVTGNGFNSLNLGRCPSDSDGLTLFGMLGLIVLAVTVLSFTIIKVPFISIVCGLGWLFYGAIVLSCNEMIGALVIFFGFGLMVVSFLSKDEVC